MPNETVISMTSKIIFSTRHSPFLPCYNDIERKWQGSRVGSCFDGGMKRPVPSRWKGVCEEGTRFTAKNCNMKLIGARAYYKGYEAAAGKIDETVDFRSARDSQGHGTHTASTAAGQMIDGASLFGMAKGVAAGMSSTARIAEYKACYSRGCASSDILAAIDQAVSDGVDVLSLSIGGSSKPYYTDVLAIASLGAVQHGVFVAAAAGNSGPSSSTVVNAAPWMMTVAASTMDRSFPAIVNLGNGQTFEGESLYSGKSTEQLPLVYGESAGRAIAKYCSSGTLSPALVKGKIVVCERGINGGVEKGQEVEKAGGAGMLLLNTASQGEEIRVDPHVLPASALGASASISIRNYTSSGNPTASIVFKGTVFGKPAPVMASFSSRGPALKEPYVIKPDVTAPGVNILAAWPPTVSPSKIKSDNRSVLFNVISGTSMSCPHVGGLAAILKEAHKEWSPAAIKSALMTTAYTLDNKKAPISDMRPNSPSATPFAYGSGHVDPEKASKPGLIYDITYVDYLYYLCSLNYSSSQMATISRGNFSCPTYTRNSENNSAICKRTVTNVGYPRTAYVAQVHEPEGVPIIVKPKVLKFRRAGQKLSYEVRFADSGKKSNSSDPSFGSLVWVSIKYTVRSPIAVTWKHDLLGGLVPLYRKRKDSGRRLVIVSWGAHRALSFPTFFAYIRCSSLFSFDHSSTLFADKQTYIVHMDKAKITALDRGEEETSPPQLLYAYETAITGFAAKLSTKQLESLNKVEGFMSAVPDEILSLHTTHSPQFLGLHPWRGLWFAPHFTTDVIIGVIDSGIWPEHVSFHDWGMPPVPSRWKGVCEEGTNFTSSNCNKKLIGAKAFFQGYESKRKKINETEDFRSPRDSLGHGTHTASIAAGNVVPGASLFGMGKGFASGMMYSSRIAVYKACYALGCFASDVLAAIDQAVSDGVDVLSLSLGGPSRPYYSDPVAIASLGAVQKGVVVAFPAGNSGPSDLSVFNSAPWMMTKSFMGHLCILATFSSRGPAFSDKRSVTFNVLSGTSMSCPHVSGIAALLKSVHKDWSPAAIKSALMTTAYTQNNKWAPILDLGFNGSESANPFAYGSGHVDPMRASNPGLIYDITHEDYLNYFATYRRTVTNVGLPCSTYVVRVQEPEGVSVRVEPNVLKFRHLNQKLSYRVSFVAERESSSSGEAVFGSLSWVFWKYTVRSPIAVTWQQPEEY
ncbi:unnamed protein product, partial [Vitis vinifera]